MLQINITMILQNTIGTSIFFRIESFQSLQSLAAIKKGHVVTSQQEAGQGKFCIIFRIMVDMYNDSTKYHF